MKIGALFSWKRENSPSLKIVNKNNKVNYHGLGLAEIEKVTALVLKDQLPRLIEDGALRIFNERIGDFKGYISSEMKELSKSEINRLSDPDTQLALRDSMFAIGRRSEEEVRAVLKKLVVRRIKDDKKASSETLKNLVFNEAISTVAKLTVDQLKIITLCYILRYTKIEKITSWEAFEKYLNTQILPFIDFKNTHTEFQHIEYTSCGGLSALSWDFLNAFKEYYGFIFQKHFDKAEVDSFNLDNVAEIFMEKEGKYIFRTYDKSTLDHVMDNLQLSELVKGNIRGLWNRTVMSTQEIKTKILEDTQNGSQLLEMWDESQLSRLSLTSVGLAIGATYFEEITGEKLDINIWIK